MFKQKSERAAGTNDPPKQIQLANLGRRPQIQNTRIMAVDEKTFESTARSKKREMERCHPERMTWRRWERKSYKNGLVMADGAERGGLNTTRPESRSARRRNAEPVPSLGEGWVSRGFRRAGTRAIGVDGPLSPLTALGKGRQSPGDEEFRTRHRRYRAFLALLTASSPPRPS